MAEFGHAHKTEMETRRACERNILSCHPVNSDISARATSCRPAALSRRRPWAELPRPVRRSPQGWMLGSGSSMTKWRGRRSTGTFRRNGPAPVTDLADSHPMRNSAQMAMIRQPPMLVGRNVTAWMLGSVPEHDEAEVWTPSFARRRGRATLPPGPAIELVPFRVRALDQFDLPLPRPPFQRLLALDRILDVEVLLVPGA